MAKVIGKEQLCCADLKYFKALQAIGGKTLFDRYQLAETNIINRHIDAEYRNFLAYPVREGDTITFHGKKYTEAPQLLSDLQGDDLARYTDIKDKTLKHYNSKAAALRDLDKTAEAGFLAEAVKYIDSRFVYCYDDRVVLGVWGMQVRDNVRADISEICKNFAAKKRKAPESPKEPGVPPAVPFAAEPPPALPLTELPPDPVPPEVEPLAAVKPKKRRPWLKWLLWLLLLLLLLLLLAWLLRSCYGWPRYAPIPYPIEGKPWSGKDPRAGGIYNPGNPYMPVPTPPGYEGVLPPHQGVLPPPDKSEIITEPGKPAVIGNRLNILMENHEKSIMDLAKDFKAVYPDAKYKVVYYDDVVKRMQIEVPPNEREKLKAEIPPKFAPQYELFVFDESLFETKYVPNDPAYSDQKKSWYLHAVKAPQAWAVTRGLPKHTVAIVDNGFNLKHPELKDKVVMPYNVWLHSDKVSPQKIDHGTHVAGTALAIAGNKKGLLGIAPNCAFMPVQVASAQGVMTTTSILDGILYALYQGADVVNVSLGADFSGLNSLPEEHQREIIRSRFKEEERVWDRIVKIADKHGAVIVTAAGNDNVLAGISPLQRPGNIITVSALDKQNQSAAKASFSNYGEYSTISAPGVDIYSTIGSGGYTMMDGTSMASPIVAGGVALMKSLNDSLTARQIICILQNTGLSAAGDVGKLIQLDKALEAVISGETAACAEPLAYCNTAVAASGGDEGYIGSFQMGQKSGTFVFRHNTHNVPDRITIHDGPDTEGNVIFTYSGGTRGVVNAAVKFNQPVITVEIISLGTGTAWDFVVNCPAGQAAPGPGVSAGQNPPGVGAPVGQTPPGYGAPPPAGRNPPAAGVPPGSSGMDDLQRERDRLQRRLDEIDKVLKTGN